MFKPAAPTRPLLTSLAGDAHHPWHTWRCAAFRGLGARHSSSGSPFGVQKWVVFLGSEDSLEGAYLGVDGKDILFVVFPFFPKAELLDFQTFMAWGALAGSY